jgi:hypothetical protein
MIALTQAAIARWPFAFAQPLGFKNAWRAFATWVLSVAN